MKLYMEIEQVKVHGEIVSPLSGFCTNSPRALGVSLEPLPVIQKQA